MAVEFVCTKCGHRHKTVSVYCAGCGERLGVPKMEKAQEPIHLGYILEKTFKGLLAAVLAAIAGAALWPLDPPDVAPDPARHRTFELTIEKLNETISRNGAADQTFAEGDINAFFATKIARQAQEAGGSMSDFSMALYKVHLRLESADRVQATIISALGPLKVSYSVIGRPVVDPRGGFRFQVREARLGHLKMPGETARGWVTEKIETVLGGLAAERNVLNRTTRMDVSAGRVRLILAPRAL